MTGWEWCGMPDADGVRACGWAFTLHVLEREALHVAAASGVALAALCVWNALRIAGKVWKLQGYSFFVLPGLAALMVTFIREPADVAYGDAPYKSWIDLATWAFGIGATYWALYWITPRLAMARANIDDPKPEAKPCG